MGIALPTEADITRAVLNLRTQPAKFQALAERYLAIREGGLYRQLTPKGRNSGGSTIGGYPDAYAIRPDGRMIIVEASAADWRSHIREEDIPNLTALGAGKVHSFHFFTLATSESLVLRSNARAEKRANTEADILTTLRKDLGITSPEIIFLDRLCTELRSPAYLSLLILDLGLPVSCAPFEEVRDVVPAAPGDIAPTREEFDANKVVPPSAYQGALEMLRLGQEVLVEGRGASGKTSMALALGRAWGERGSAYYLDLQVFDVGDSSQMARLESTVVTLASPGTLLIFDNCHLVGTGNILKILEATRIREDRPATAWFTRPGTETLEKRFASQSHIVREADVDDLEWIYRRLAGRVRLNAPPPPPEALSDWRAMRGDLVAFAMALNPRLTAFKPGGDWTLSKARAVDYVRDKYLTPLSPEARQAVIRIASLAAFEMPTSRQSLGGVEPEDAIQSGVLIRSVHGGTRVRFRLTHHALGELLLKAAGVADDYRIDDAFILEDVFQSSFLARRHHQLGDDAEARRILHLLRPAIVSFSPDIPPGYLGPITHLMVDLGVATEAELEAGFLENIEAFPSGTVPAVGLSGFFGLTHGRMPKLHEAAVQRARSEGTIKAILDTLVLAPASAVMSLVKVSVTHGIGIETELLAALSDPHVLDVVAVNLLNQEVSDIDTFVVTYKEIDPKGCDRLLTLLKGSNPLRRRSEELLRQPFSVIGAFLFVSPTATALLLSEITVDAWRERDWAMDVNLAEVLHYGLKNLIRIGRPDLADELARQASRRRDSAMWSRARQAKTRLCDLAILADAIEPAVLGSLGRDLKDKGWLDPIYNQTSAPVLVDLVTRLWRVLTPEGLQHYRTPTLERNLGRPLKPAALRDAAAEATAIRAAGLLLVLGAGLPAVHPSSLNFDAPTDGEADLWIYWIGYAALTGTLPAGSSAPPWTAADLSTLPAWVADPLRQVDRWVEASLRCQVQKAI